MYKNTTILIGHYQLKSKNNLKLISRVITPLFQLSAHDYSHFKSHQHVLQLFRAPYLIKKTNQVKKFERILIMYANVYSNARRSKLINIKRNIVLQNINQYSQTKCLYFLILNKVNYFVPESQLNAQLKIALQKINQKCARKTYENSTKYLNFNTNTSILKILNNFNLPLWQEYIKYRFQIRNLKGLKLLKLQLSYIQLQLMNSYKIKYSKEPQIVYQDIKDFDKMLNKFNFIRFFYTSTVFNTVRAEKNCQALIKMIQWRTKQTEEYLLFLIRNNSWQRFCLYLQNFIFFYQRDVLNINKNQSQRIKNNKI